MNEFNTYELQRKKLIFSGFVVLIFFLLFIGFFKIQVTGSSKYQQIAVDNSVRPLTQYPIRGTIRDTNGNILVDNRASFILSVIPREMTRDILSEVSECINEPVELIKEKLRGENNFRPVIIKRDLEYETVAKLEERRLRLPGVLVEVESKRFYPENVNSPHIFGYVGEVTNEELHDGELFESGEMIGKSGLEFIYDASLRGVKGVQYVRVDAEGREFASYGRNLNIEPIPGMDLYLTLDYSIQQFAESLMVNHRGAVIAIDVRTGGIVTFVSKPDFDPRQFSGKISPEIWASLQNDPSHPLYSRVIQSTYPPGSTFKLVAAIAALQEGIITPNWKAYCPGYFTIGRKTIRCWNTKGHGEIDLLHAIKGSCNVYFYQLGLKIGLETWSHYSKMLLFGRKSGIDLPNENRGLVPTVEYFNNRYGKNGWTRGNLANLAIGQGELLTTPLQMAQLAMILATKGTVRRPHLTDYLYDRQTGDRNYFPVETNYLSGISDEVYDFIREAMRLVVAGGTGWRGSVYGVEIAGKTGTSQNPHGEDHAWFIAFAPVDNPLIAMAVVLENGGAGGAVAAPIASQVMEKYFYNRLLPRKVANVDSINQKYLESHPPLDINNVKRIEISLPVSN